MPLEAQFLGLPGELLVECLKHLDWEDLVRCKQVSKRLRDVVNDSLELQYRIELGADGLVEGLGCTYTTAERLQLLLQRRARWRYLDWSRIVPISAPGLCQAYELVDGVFASSMGNDFFGSRHLELTWLPTSTQEARKIEREDLGIRIRDFAIDPSQDLMALVLADDVTSMTIHLRTISRNEPHPKARIPELRATVPQVRNCFVQIVDDVIGAFFWFHGPGLVIWNWRTGKKVVDCVGVNLPTGTYDFAFISSRAYIVTVTMQYGSIEVYTFSGGDEDAETLSNTVPQSPSLGDRLLPTRVAIFRLPPTKPGQDLRRFLTHSAPFVANPTPGRVFEVSRDARVHMMCLYYGDHAGSYHLFLHNRFLLAHIPPGIGSGAVGKVTAVAKEWDEWGPDNARFVNWIAHFQWLRRTLQLTTQSPCARYLHGERVIFPPIPLALRQPTGDDEVKMVMLMIDFHVHPKRTDDPVKPPLELDEAGGGYEIVARETVIDSGAVFQHPVVSRLPYAMSTRSGVRGLVDYTGFMIDQDQLIAMKVNAKHTQHFTMSALITIPGATAHHVLGQSNVTLGAGELNLVPASSDGKDLMLTVGSAGFTLHHGTAFGTLEGDPRAYVFNPEIEGLDGGFVKITLPEGVTEDGSQLSTLQTKFEEVLIAHGLLQPSADDASREGTGAHHAVQKLKSAIHSDFQESLVDIPGCVVAQVLGDEPNILSKGTLSLFGMIKSAKEEEPVLTLVIGKSAFPLQFELALIDHGLLKDGFEAAADEVARSVREGSARVAQRVRDARELYLRTHPRTTEPVVFHPAAQNMAGSAERGTQTLANIAHGVSGSVLGAASVAGSWFARTFVPTEPKVTERLNSAARGTMDVAGGVGAGVQDVKDALEHAGCEVIENDYGKEARVVVGNVGQSVGNVGAVAADAATVTSGGPVLAADVIGAASEQNKELRKRDIEEVKADGVPEESDGVDTEML
ncbi:hypothetical protein BD309DRAFT_990477 [Dichomitus squalens]|uniref:Uncharacterized protein n=1 Tax=Dichomitus squalens TaxID=114155 RepID=A0A4Q9NRF3_9APHY|nr:hypothetical protein BD309DRAFT_990477 [Dichomitus squalens]TBU54245.1 hypothetical protein BD310DRAFT_951568 [Dichomitus squalens]